jgi:solute carrier family 32 (vesicular inhibitory amino acid transporter)
LNQISVFLSADILKISFQDDSKIRQSSMVHPVDDYGSATEETLLLDATKATTTDANKPAALTAAVSAANQSALPVDSMAAAAAAAAAAGTDDTLDSTSSTSTIGTQDLLWQEQQRPWPSTFERSIALLASPILHKDQVAHYTSSPKPGLFNVAHQQQQRRGSGTMDHSMDSETNLQFLSVPKVQSLDFLQHGINLQAAQSAQSAQAQRLALAQQYRQKILQQKGANQRKPSSRLPHTAPKAGSSHRNKATIVQCAFNLANILMGVGLLGLPFCFRVVGWYGGIVCLVLFGSVTWRTSILIGRQLNGDPRPAHMFQSNDNAGDTATMTRMWPTSIASFPDIARASFGEPVCILLSLVLYFELFSCIAIFFVSMGDHLHQLFPSLSTSSHMVLVSTASLVPTILLKTPALLSYLSMVGTVATIAVVMAVIASAVMMGDIAQKVVHDEHLTDIVPPYHVNWQSDGLTLASGLVAYCFSGHAILPSIYTSMQRPQDFETMVTYTFLLVIACCLAVGMSGYLMFGSTVQDQVTLSLERSSDAVYTMKALTWLMIMTAFSKVTLTMFPLALGIEETVTPYLTSEQMVEYASSAIKLLLTILALGVAVFCPSFSFLCSLVGLVCTMTVSVIFPCAAHLKMFGPKLSWSQKLMDWIFIVFGVVLGIVGTLASLN